LHALTNLGTRQSAGQRLLAREVAGLTARIPRHAVLLPPREDESLELSETEREASSWIRRLKDWRAHGKRAGKGVVSKEYRLFFLCGHDHSLAECGFEGKGYRIRCPREWVRKGGLPFMKALLIVVSVALKTFAGLSIPTDGIASVGGQAWDEVISSTVEGAVEASIEAGCSALGEKQVEGSAIMELDEARVGDAGHNVGEHSNVSSKFALLVLKVIAVQAIAVYGCLGRFEQREHSVSCARLLEPRLRAFVGLCFFRVRKVHDEGATRCEWLNRAYTP